MNPTPSPAREAATYPPLPPARHINCGIDLFIALDMREFADAHAFALLAAKQEEVDKMREALVCTREALERANTMPGGPIIDTIWYDASETLFDYIDSFLSPTQGEAG